MTGDVKTALSKLNFALNRNPKVDRCCVSDQRRYIPESFKAVLLVCADFELAWAWRFANGHGVPLVDAIERARIERNNIPRVVELCDTYTIPVTWATVGHLFLDRCCRNGGRAHPDQPRIPYHENAYWKFDRGDWYDDDPGTDWRRAPEWYAPDLIRMILNAKTRHEIACHTFSHIDCSHGVCTPEILASEVLACRESSRLQGLQLRTFVHPGHTIGHLRTLAELGFTSYRTDFGNTLGYPRKDESGLWELKSTMEFAYRKGWSDEYHVYRYTEIVNRAIAHRRVCVFWFHPSVSHRFVDRVMPRLFRYLDTIRESLWITTVDEYVGFLNRRSDAQR